MTREELIALMQQRLGQSPVAQTGFNFPGSGSLGPVSEALRNPQAIQPKPLSPNANPITALGGGLNRFIEGEPIAPADAMVRGLLGFGRDLPKAIGNKAFDVVGAPVVDFFTPYANKPTVQATSEQERGGSLPILNRALAERMQQMQEGSGFGNALRPIDLGPQPQLPNIPMEPAAAGIDYSKVRELLGQTAPSSVDEAALESAGLQNIFMGLAAGVADAIDSGQGFGRGLLNAGIGALGGRMKGEADAQKAREAAKESARDFAARQANLEQSIAESEARERELNREISYKNMLRLYDKELSQIKTAQPELLSLQNGIAFYKMVDPETGQQQVRGFDTGFLERLTAMKAAAKGQGLGQREIDLLSTKMAIDTRDPWGFSMAVAADVLERGGFSAFPEIQKELEAAARSELERIGPAALSDEKLAAAATNRAHVALLAGVLQGSPEALKRAVPYSPMARALLASGTEIKE